MTTHVSIGTVKKDISELVNRVMYGGDQIILTSRGKPKAALINMEDFEKLKSDEGRKNSIKKWLADSRRLSDQIEQRSGQIDIDTLLEADRDDLETR